MKRIYYTLSILIFIVAAAKIGIYIGNWIIPLIFFIVGIALPFFKKESFSLYAFLFLLPVINSSPAFFSNPFPHNYIAPSLFLLCGILLSTFFFRMKNKIESPLVSFEDRGFTYYYMFLLILVVSTIFVFLRWSNITLGDFKAIGADSTVSPPLPRTATDGSIQLIEQNVSFASIFPLLSLFLYFITPFIFFYIRRMKPQETQVFKWLSFGFYISTAIAFIQKITGQSLISDRLGKDFKQFNGGFSDFNAFGVFAGIMFLWSTYEIKKKNPIGYITFGISLIGGILSGSRTMFVFAAAGLVNLAFESIKTHSKQQKIIAAVLILVFIVLIIFAGGTLKKRLMGEDWDKHESLFDKVDAAVNGRLKMAVFSAEIIRDYPGAGIGNGNYTFYLTYKHFESYKKTGKLFLYDLPLNQYLWVFVENGVLAFLFFVLFAIYLYVRSSKKLLTGTMLFVLLFNCYLWFPEAFLLFWVVAAFSYTPSDSPNPLLKRVTWLVIFSIVVSILFNILSFRSLHPKTWADETGISYEYGFWSREKDPEGKFFHWTKEKAGIRLKLDQEGQSPLIRVVCSAPFDKLKLSFQRVSFYWRGKKQKEVVFPGNGRFEYRVKSKPGEEGFLGIRVSPSFRLKKGEPERGIIVYELEPAAF